MNQAIQELSKVANLSPSAGEHHANSKEAPFYPTQLGLTPGGLALKPLQIYFSLIPSPASAGASYGVFFCRPPKPVHDGFHVLANFSLIPECPLLKPWTVLQLPRNLGQLWTDTSLQCCQLQLSPSRSPLTVPRPFTLYQDANHAILQWMILWKQPSELSQQVQMSETPRTKS